MTLTPEQSEIARLTEELRNLRIAQDRCLQKRTLRLSAMLDSLYRDLREQGENLKAACIAELMQHLSDLDGRFLELIPADNKVTPLSRHAG
jgi:hypothetical protein